MVGRGSAVGAAGPQPTSRMMAIAVASRTQQRSAMCSSPLYGLASPGGGSPSSSRGTMIPRAQRSRHQPRIHRTMLEYHAESTLSHPEGASEGLPGNRWGSCADQGHIHTAARVGCLGRPHSFPARMSRSPMPSGPTPGGLLSLLCLFGPLPMAAQGSSAGCRSSSRSLSTGLPANADGVQEGSSPQPARRLRQVPLPFPPDGDLRMPVRPARAG
jgi:hypothetical protein